MNLPGKAKARLVQARFSNEPPGVVILSRHDE